MKTRIFAILAVLTLGVSAFATICGWIYPPHITQTGGLVSITPTPTPGEHYTPYTIVCKDEKWADGGCASDAHAPDQCYLWSDDHSVSKYIGVQDPVPTLEHGFSYQNPRCEAAYSYTLHIQVGKKGNACIPATETADPTLPGTTG